uniref:uncharacterized protein LOC129519294 n=1 Tax=Nyctereutes procyonoides TaxID=34880 RepID=UPI0024450216|nr:uncharacterized protein LOC129519294 [Nyctereutes procyonoides]
MTLLSVLYVLLAELSQAGKPTRAGPDASLMLLSEQRPDTQALFTRIQSRGGDPHVARRLPPRGQADGTGLSRRMQSMEGKGATAWGVLGRNGERASPTEIKGPVGASRGCFWQFISGWFLTRQKLTAPRCTERHDRGVREGGHVTVPTVQAAFWHWYRLRHHSDRCKDGGGETRQPEAGMSAVSQGPSSTARATAASLAGRARCFGHCLNQRTIDGGLTIVSL